MRAINSVIHLIKRNLEKYLTNLVRGGAQGSGDDNDDESSRIQIKIPFGYLLFSTILITTVTYGFVVEPEKLPKNIYDKLETLENI